MNNWNTELALSMLVSLILEDDFPTLFHGTHNPEYIPIFTQDYTVGAGMYLSSDKSVASAYARRRTHTKGGEATVCTVEIEGLRILDLRTAKNMRVFLPVYGVYLRKIKGELKAGLPWYVQGCLDDAISKIDQLAISPEAPIGMKSYADNTGDHLFRLVQELGLYGLVTVEGGEPDNNPQIHVDPHDSWVLNPAVVRIIHREPASIYKEVVIS